MKLNLRFIALWRLLLIYVNTLLFSAQKIKAVESGLNEKVVTISRGWCNESDDAAGPVTRF